MGSAMSGTPGKEMRFLGYSVTLDGENRPLLLLDCTIEPGACLAIMGASGRGKSTILSLIAGFKPVWARAEGAIHIGAARIDHLPPEERRLGLMLQDDLLFPHLTVGGNLLFGLGPRIAGRAARRAVVEEALASAGLGGFFDRKPEALSGGQRSRVSLLRSLLAEPRALLLDEPFSKLDIATRGRIRDFVFDEARRRGLPVLLVTHDIRDAEAAEASIITLPEASES
jgi:putative thiamine transport system ATP-binding protein